MRATGTVLALALVVAACGERGAPPVTATDPTSLLTYRQALATADADSCQQLHRLSLDAVRNLGAAVGDGPAIPGYDEVAAEDLMHAGGLGMAMVAPDPSLPYGRWGNAMTVLDTQVSFAAHAAEGEAPDPATEAAARSYMEEAGADGLVAMRSPRATTSSAAPPRTKRRRSPPTSACRPRARPRRAHGHVGPHRRRRPGRRRGLRDHPEHRRPPPVGGGGRPGAAEGAAQRGESITLPELPTALAEATRVVPTAGGVCVSLLLRRRLAITSLEDPGATVVVPQGHRPLRGHPCRARQRRCATQWSPPPDPRLAHSHRELAELVATTG